MALPLYCLRNRGCDGRKGSWERVGSEELQAQAQKWRAMSQRSGTMAIRTSGISMYVLCLLS